MPISVNVTVKDAKGATASTTFHIPSATAHDDALEYAAEVGQYVATLSNGEVTNVSITYPVDISSFTGNTLVSTSDVEEGGLFLWETEGGYKSRNRIAAFIETFVNTTDKTIPIDVGNTVQDFVDMVTGGFTAISTNVVETVDYRGDVIDTCNGAKEQFTRSRILRS